MRSNDLYVFYNLFGDPCPLCKYDILEKKQVVLLIALFIIHGYHFYI